MPWTNAEELRSLDEQLSGCHIALLSAITDANAGTVTEVTGTGYARKPVSGNIGSSATDGSGVANATNAAIIRWDSLDSGSSKTVAGFGIYTASSGGTLRAVIARTGGSTTVPAASPFEVPTGGLVFTKQSA